MWTSVPQIAVREIRILTSWTPTSGSGASSTIQTPSVRSDLTSAFIAASRERARARGSDPSDHPQLPPHLLERRHGQLQVLPRVRRTHLRPDARLPAGNHRIEESHRVDARVEQP